MFQQNIDPQDTILETHDMPILPRYSSEYRKILMPSPCQNTVIREIPGQWNSIFYYVIPTLLKCMYPLLSLYKIQGRRFFERSKLLYKI